jgi:hypothetical protein
MNKSDIISYLQIAASAVKQGANLFLAQPALSAAMRVAGGLLDVAVTLLERGVDPVEHITRLVDLDEKLNEARLEVDAEAKAQYGTE